MLAGYLPAQLSDDELASLVTAAIAETGAAGMPAMGKVMKAVTPQVAGRADGARVAAEVRRQLSRKSSVALCGVTTTACDGYSQRYHSGWLAS